MPKTLNQEQLIQALFSGKKGKKYFGKHVAIINGHVMLLPVNPQEASTLLDRLETKYQEIPEIVFVPRPETYILTFRNFNIREAAQFIL